MFSALGLISVNGGDVVDAAVVEFLRQRSSLRFALTKSTAMASASRPPPRAARSASTLYEWPCSGSEMPRYSRRKCAASKRASTRTVN